MTVRSFFLPILGLIVLGTLLVLMVVFPQSVVKSYHYLSVDADIVVHDDATLTVSETLTLKFLGTFHQSTRYIPLKNLSAIGAISVVDAGTKQEFLYSPTKLDKLDPTSWGKYTTYTEDGQYFIEWYHEVENTVRSWIITYQVHGGITIEKEEALLNWNVFTGYHVPVDHASVTVHLPRRTGAVGLPATGGTQDAWMDTPSITASSEQGSWPGKVVDNSTLRATRTAVPATESFTIRAVFPSALLR